MHMKRDPAAGRNPDWNRDELILALDFYLRWKGNPPPKTSADIAELSRTVREVQAALGTEGEATLRNINGVYMKLMNFRRFDPAYTARGRSGLKRGNRLEGVVWNDFAEMPDRLARVAGAIRSVPSMLPEALSLSTDYILEAEAIEGRLLTILHRRRERSRSIVEKKKAAVLRASGVLICEACDFSYLQRYGERGRGFIECHHTTPIESLGNGMPTRLSDLALLCANCHRMIHAGRPWLTVAELRASLA
jgi:5-methylcytosine-specific restriction enzyme A